jgi:hypothetical protein
LDIDDFTHKFDYMAGVVERTPLEMLQCIASRGEPAALELLRSIPHHNGKIIGDEIEVGTITEHIRDVITRIMVAEDIEIDFSLSR